MTSQSLVFHCKALTDIWTGDRHGRNDHLQLTGLLGSIRWWAEAIVRAFEFRACDPTMREGPDQLCETGHLCLICKLFGNSNVPQAAKFAIRCWGNAQRTEVFTKKLEKDADFWLQFLFCRAPEQHELWLLAKTMEIVSQYGSVGGKTILKPTNDATAPKGDVVPWRKRHTDYGILSVSDVEVLGEAGAFADTTAPFAGIAADAGGSGGLPNINRFWFAPGITLYVHGTFKQLLDCPAPPAHKALSRDAEGVRLTKSKRVFSFSGAPAGQPPVSAIARTWGWVSDPALWNRATVAAWLRAVGIANPVWGEDIRTLPLNLPMVAPALAAGARP